MNRKLVDPIGHAWRCCNPNVPVPSPLEQDAVLSTKAPMAEPSVRRGKTGDTQHRMPRHPVLR